MKLTELSDSQLLEKQKKIENIKKLIQPFENYSGVDKVVPALQIKEKVEATFEQTKYLTSLNKLNEILNGFKAGDLITMSGISGNGKTELLISFTKDFIDREYRVLWISFEVNPKDFMNRFGNYEPLFYMPQQNIPNNLKWVKQRIYEAKAKYDIQIVMIDHLHFLLDMATLGNSNISHLFGGIIRQIKSMCLELDITVFLVAHLNKNQNSAEIPDLKDFRDSSFTYQEADTVLIIHREQTDQEIDLNKTSFPAKLRIAKNRWEGYIGTINLTYDKQKRRYYSH